MTDDDLGEVHLSDGQVLPITNFFDDDGDECGADDAVVCVAGPDADGYWLSVDLRLLERASVH